MDRAAKTLARDALRSPKAKALLREAVLNRWIRLTRALKDTRLAPDDIHRLRLMTKKCRYLLASYPSAHQTCGGEWLKQLQGRLGDLHDIEQANVWLRQQQGVGQPDAFLRTALKARTARLNAQLNGLLRTQPSFVF
jgi:CHAD domain-containing protein